MHININIRKARELKKFSQQKVADLIGEKRSTYAEWENNTEPKGAALRKIAEVLEVSIDDLLSKDFANRKPDTYNKASGDKKEISQKEFTELVNQVKALNAVVETLIMEVASLRAEKNGENVLTVIKRLQKAAELPVG